MEINGRKYLYDIVYDTLKTEILEGKLDYGVLLPSEREIAIRFSVERTTVRKALQLLVDDGLVEKKAGIGTKVIFRKVGRKKESSSEHKKVIGFFMSDDAQNGFSITQPFYAQLFYSLEIECRKKDYQLMYASVNEDTNVRELLDSQDYYLIKTFLGKVEGEIAVEERGDLGFAFDPLFYVPSLDKTFGELTTEEKNQFSHRKNSLKKFIEWYSSQE